jgi:multiple sugar transport system permease protein/sorbitol/mannitol transport system permease protein
VAGSRVIDRGGRLASQAGLWAWIVASAVPLVFMVVTSMKTQPGALTIPPAWIFRPTAGAFASVWRGGAQTPPFRALLVHSLVITAAVTAATVLLAVLAAYGLTLRSFRWRKALSSWILSTYMFPPIVAVVPVYLVETRLGLQGSYAGIIIPEISFNLPIVTWLVRRGMAELPYEIEEAAAVDGASRLRILRTVVIPLTAPVIATGAILTAILTWNEFLFAISLTNQGTEPAPAALLSFTGMYGTQWSLLCAASLIVTGPMVVLALVMRRRLVSGLTLGAIK